MTEQLVSPPRWLVHFIGDRLEKHLCPSWQCRWIDWALVECVSKHPDEWETVHGPTGGGVGE